MERVTDFKLQLKQSHGATFWECTLTTCLICVAVIVCINEFSNNLRIDSSDTIAQAVNGGGTISGTSTDNNGIQYGTVFDPVSAPGGTNDPGVAQNDTLNSNPVP